MQQPRECSIPNEYLIRRNIENIMVKLITHQKQFMIKLVVRSAAMQQLSSRQNLN